MLLEKCEYMSLRITHVGTKTIKCLWCIIKRAYILQNYMESWNEKLTALKMLNNAIKQKLTTCYHNGYPFIFFPSRRT